MSKIFDVNRIATYGGSTAMFYLKQTLKSASWTVSGSSDGTTFYSASDGITTDNSGSGGMNNNNAWFFMVDPNGRRGFTAGRGTGVGSDRKWAIQTFENLSGVLMGTCSLTTPPTTTVINYTTNGVFTLFGGEPSIINNMFPPSGTFRAHSVAISGSHNGVWPFYHFCSELGTSIGNTTTLFYCDPLLSGTTETNDGAPLTWKCIYSTGSLAGTAGLNSSPTDFNIPLGLTWYGAPSNYIRGTAHTYVRFGLYLVRYQYPAAVFKYGFIHGTDYTAQYASLPTNGIGSIDSSNILVPITWINSYNGLPYFNIQRGISAFLKINLNGGFDGAGSCYPDTINLTTNAYVMVGSGLAMPWPENVVAKY